MNNVRRCEYRGYRVETYFREPSGWQVYLYRLNLTLPPLMRQRDIRYPVADDALSAGKREIDEQLSGSPSLRTFISQFKFKTTGQCKVMPSAVLAAGFERPPEA